jgi:hypothetical protein
MRTNTIPTLPIALVLTALALLLAGVPAASAYTSPNPSLNATLLYYTPVPATPGSILDAFIQIGNSGTTASKVSVEFVDNSPFSLDSQSDRVRSTDSIPAQGSFLLKYKVRVSKDALPGTNYIKLQYTIGESGNAQSVLLPIDVKGTSATLNVESVDLAPATFAPGSTGKITLAVRNLAQLKVSSGTVKLDLANVDMAPIGSTDQQRFTDMQPDEVRTFEFNLAPSPGITPGVYKIPVSITFKDQQGVEYTMTEYIGVQVGVEPELLVYFDQTSISTDTKSGTAIIKFVNKGLSEIKFLEMEVLESKDVTVLSESNKVYVGNIAQDDYQTAELSLKTSKDVVDVPLRVTYRDALNRPYDQTVTLKLTAKDASGSGSSGWVLWAVIIAVVGVIGWWAVRRWRGKRK